MDSILLVLVVVSAGFSFFYSMKTRRYRKEGNVEWMSYYNARTNIAMGTMLLAMSIIQFTFPEVTGWRIAIGSLFFLVGFFNLFMGIRHYQQQRTGK